MPPTIACYRRVAVGEYPVRRRRGERSRAVDEIAVRNTQDIDILPRRGDLPAATAALEAAAFSYRRVAGLDLFLDGPGAKPRDAVHIVFANERVRPHEPASNPDLTASVETEHFRVVSLESLVQIKLTAFRDKDRTHIRDLIGVGLVDAGWLTRLPAALAARLRQILDTPDGWYPIPRGARFAPRRIAGTTVVSMRERIHKVLANAGIDSRRKIEEMIRQGRVSVNGEVRTELPILIDPDDDRIEIDGEPVRLARRDTGPRMYILMNKPKGVYATNVAQGVQKRAIDLLPPNLPGRVYPVGRLDADTKGLLLLTNDGDLTHKLTHPRFGVLKTYRAVVDGYVDAETSQKIEKGVWLADPSTGAGFRTGRSRVKIAKRTRQFTVLEITLVENRNPQVRRTLARLGHKVKDLTRIKFGPLTADGLAPGKFRPLTKQEVRKLRALVDREEKLGRTAPRVVADDDA